MIVATARRTAALIAFAVFGFATPLLADDKPAVRPKVSVGHALRAVARDILEEARAPLDDPERSDAVAVHAAGCL